LDWSAEDLPELENWQGPRILLAALGNVLLKDDGVGVHLVRHLQQHPIPGVLPVEVGTAVLDALHLLEWADQVLAVDAVEAGNPPGTIYQFDVSQAGKDQRKVSLHELSLVGALRLIPEHLHPKQIVIVGVEPQTIDYGLELSPAVQAMFPKLVEAVSHIVGKWRKPENGAQKE
jgi:hydrogenase maturation protease